MKKTLVMSVAAFALTATSASAFAKDAPGQKFLRDAVQGNYAEVSMGELAQQNGGSDAVKSYGQMLQTDHEKANEAAISAAQSGGMTPPDGPSKKQQAMHDRMAKLSGAAFDKHFAQAMIADHKKDIAEYKKEAKRSDGAISSYASDQIPTLEKHLGDAQSLTSRKAM